MNTINVIVPFHSTSLNGLFKTSLKMSKKIIHYLTPKSDAILTIFQKLKITASQRAAIYTSVPLTSLVIQVICFNPFSEKDPSTEEMIPLLLCAYACNHIVLHSLDRLIRQLFPNTSLKRNLSNKICNDHSAILLGGVVHHLFNQALTLTPLRLIALTAIVNIELLALSAHWPDHRQHALEQWIQMEEIIPYLTEDDFILMPESIIKIRQLIYLNCLKKDATLFFEHIQFPLHAQKSQENSHPVFSTYTQQYVQNMHIKALNLSPTDQQNLMNKICGIDVENESKVVKEIHRYLTFLSMTQSHEINGLLKNIGLLQEKIKENKQEVSTIGGFLQWWVNGNHAEPT
jgi:hypothetical protein